MSNSSQPPLLDELLGERAKCNGEISKILSEGDYYHPRLERLVKEGDRLNRHIAALERQVKQDESTPLRKSA